MSKTVRRASKAKLPTFCMQTGRQTNGQLGFGIPLRTFLLQGYTDTISNQ